MGYYKGNRFLSTKLALLHISPLVDGEKLLWRQMQVCSSTPWHNFRLHSWPVFPAGCTFQTPFFKLGYLILRQQVVTNQDDNVLYILTCQEHIQAFAMSNRATNASTLSVTTCTVCFVCRELYSKLVSKMHSLTGRALHVQHPIKQHPIKHTCLQFVFGQTNEGQGLDKMGRVW